MRAGVLVAVAVAALATVGPTILGGGAMSLVGLAPLPIILLAGGLLLRRRGSRGDRNLASVLLVAGVIGLGLIAALIWLLFQGFGRPY